MTQDSQKIISISSLLFFFLFIIFPLNAEAHHNPYVHSFASSAGGIFITVCNSGLAKLHVFSFDNFKHLWFNPIHVDNIPLDFQKEQVPQKQVLCSLPGAESIILSYMLYYLKEAT